jgi:ATP-dependent Clp protease protease subunit
VIDRAIDRDTWMSAEEAKTFGLLDQVVSDFKQLDAIHNKKK